MVDSAPELRLTVRSGLIPSKVRPVAGSYIATPAGLLPKNQAPAIPARSANAGRPGRGRRPEQVLQGGVGPVGDLDPVAGRRQPAVLGPALGEQVGGEPARLPHRDPDPVFPPKGAPGLAREPAIWSPQACHSQRDLAQGSRAPYGQSRTSPSGIRATPSASRRRSSRPRADPPARSRRPGRRPPRRRRRPRRRSARRAGAARRPSGRSRSAGRGPGGRGRQGTAPAAHAGTRRRPGRRRGRRRSPRQGPRRSGPASTKGRSRRVGLLGRGRARVQGAVRLHPQHHVAGLGPEESGGRSRPAAAGRRGRGCAGRRTAASGAGTPPPPGSCRRR